MLSSIPIDSITSALRMLAAVIPEAAIWNLLASIKGGLVDLWLMIAITTNTKPPPTAIHPSSG